MDLTRSLRSPLTLVIATFLSIPPQGNLMEPATMDKEHVSYEMSHALCGQLLCAVRTAFTRRAPQRTSSTTTSAWDDAQNEKKQLGPGGVPRLNHYGNEVLQIDYQKYVQKGQKLTDYLAMTAVEVHAALITEGKASGSADCQSQFTTFQQLAANGWQEIVGLSDTVPGLESAYNGLGMLKSVIDFEATRQIDMSHNQSYMHGGQQHIGTLASYSCIYCPAKGLIVSNGEYSPRQRILKLLPGSPGLSEPPLKHWSDVVFLAYQNVSNDRNCSVRSLKHIIRNNIANNTTQNVIELAMQQKYHRSYPAPSWKERCVFDAGDEGANAILASPNGRGVAWLLLTHRAQLGQKRMKSIAVFEQDESEDILYGPSLYFELEDVPVVQAAKARLKEV